MKNKNETIIDPRIDINKLNDMKIVVETLKQLSTEKTNLFSGCSSRSARTRIKTSVGGAR